MRLRVPFLILPVLLVGLNACAEAETSNEGDITLTDRQSGQVQQAIVETDAETQPSENDADSGAWDLGFGEDLERERAETARARAETERERQTTEDLTRLAEEAEKVLGQSNEQDE